MNKLLLAILFLMGANIVHATHERAFSSQDKDMANYFKSKQYNSRTYCLAIKDLSLKRVCLRETNRNK